MKTFSKDVSLVFGGEAGQGIQTIEKLCFDALAKAGYCVFSSSEYMSRVRGGSNSTEIRVSEKRKTAFVERIDILFPLDCDAIGHLKDRIDENTVIIADDALIPCLKDREHIAVPFLKVAEEVGGKIFLNVVMASFVLSFFDVEKRVMEDFLRAHFARKGEDVVAKNILAVEKGWELGQQVSQEQEIAISVSKTAKQENLDTKMSGAEAVALGAVTGGCDFIASYPMSPATPVFNALAGLSRDFAIAVEQAEDEIGAVNMGLGAWFAGGRAIVSTSGGGFALMVETVSLAGMMESPMVFHIAQRPGPATGLPTQTEQGDLQFVLYSGHGDFARVILAPGSIEEGFEVTKKAFDLADKYQIPVFILTDQFYMDMLAQGDSRKMKVDKCQKYFVETDEKYKRYKYTDDGLSPRGIPGFGKGFVCTDSDEHEEDGHITESHETRVAMVDKRMARLEMAREDALPAELYGSDDYTTLLVGWGSTCGVIREALEVADVPRVSFLHVPQVYPVGDDVLGYLERAERVVVIENNATGQLADILEKASGKKITERVLQYDGRPFSVEKIFYEIKHL